MSKRSKFERDESLYTIIPHKEICEINKRISEAMKPIVKEFERKERESLKQIINDGKFYKSRP